MVADSTSRECGQCGRLAWAADRFCAGCGEALESPRSADAPGRWAENLVRLQPIGEPRPDPVVGSGGRRELRGALAVAGVIGALIIVMTIVRTGNDTAKQDQTSVAATPAVAAATPALTPTAEPTTQPVFGSAFATATPEAPTATPAPDLAGALRGIGLGTGWIGTAGGDGVRLVSLETGETLRILVTPDVFFNAPLGAVTASGVLVPDWNGRSTGGWIMHYWDGRLPVPVDVSPGSTVIMVIDDAVRGPLAITGPDGTVPVNDSGGVQPRAGFEALAINTGERQVIPLSPALASDLVASHWFGPTFAHRATQLTVSLADRLYRWTWDGGLEELGSGTVVARAANALVIRGCAAPDSCDLEVRDNDAARLGSLDAFLTGTYGLLSSDGSYWVSISGSLPSAGGYRLVDVEAAQVSTFDGEPWDLAWLGDRYLIQSVGGSLRGAVLDAATGATSELPLSPSTFGIFYLDHIER